LKNKLSDGDLKRINRLLRDKSYHLNGVNYIQFIPVDKQKKCSVVCEYQNCDEYIAFDGTNKSGFKNENDASEFYYGLSPVFSETKIIDAIIQGHFRSAQTFESFLVGQKETNESKKIFMLHVGQEKYIKAIYAKTILRLASRFGICAYCRDKTKFIRFKEFLMVHTDCFILNVSYKLSEENLAVFFLAGISDVAAQCLTEGGYYLKDSEKLMITDYSEKNSIPFSNVYSIFADKNKSHLEIQLCSGSVYYSGVMPRVLDIDLLNTYSNPDVQTIKLTVERTTFATLDAFDYSDINSHPFLEPYRTLIEEFDSHEDEVQNKYLFQSSADKKGLIQNINEYLKESYNTHTVAVSGNIVTKDKYYLIAERGSTSIDRGTCYCSINGQSEFLDENVDFYRNSVYEDYPTMIAENKKRIDFGQELFRETYAETAVSELKVNWEYYGIAILGIDNSGKDKVTNRRMHFNVLALNYTEKDFIEILDAAEDATERFENKNFYGIHFNVFLNQKKRFQNWLSNILTFMANHNDIFASSLAFVYFLLNALLHKGSSTDVLELADSIISFLLAFSVILYTVTRIVKYVKADRQIKPFCFKINQVIGKNLIDDIEEIIDKLDAKVNSHPILYLMSSLLSLGIILDDDGHKSKR
jgi:hypothetical protein